MRNNRKSEYRFSLLRSQKNQVFEIIKGQGLDPFNFEWTTSQSGYNEGDVIPCLKYRNTPYYFNFDRNKKEHWTTFSPGYQEIEEKWAPCTWKDQLIMVEEWLKNLKREIEPDMWDKLSEFHFEASVSVDPEVENKSFSSKEITLLAEGMNKIRHYLEIELEANEVQTKLIDEKIDYLIDAAKRQGRLDWIHTSIGVVFTLYTALGLTVEHGKMLMQLLKATVRGMVGLLTP